MAAAKAVENYNATSSSSRAPAPAPAPAPYPGQYDEPSFEMDIDSFLHFDGSAPTAASALASASVSATGVAGLLNRSASTTAFGYQQNMSGPAPLSTGAGAGVGRPAGRPTTPGSSEASIARFEKYARRLAPLLQLEQRLMRQLSFPDEDDDPSLTGLSANEFGNVSGGGATLGYTYSQNGVVSVSTPADGQGQGQRAPRAWNTFTSSPPHLLLPASYSSSPASPSSTPSPISPNGTLLKGGELALRPSSNWKKINPFGGQKTVHSGEVFGWWEDPEDPVHTLNACAHGAYGMSALWRDTEVRAVLARRRVRMEESSGFYLNEIDRITAKKYIPTDDDVLKARLKTLGVVEHSFTIKGSERGAEWKIYDVGGARHQRQAWAPYFEDGT